jgi:hypothetical protein
MPAQEKRQVVAFGFIGGSVAGNIPFWDIRQVVAFLPTLETFV